MAIETLLHAEIEDQFGALANMEKGSDEYKATVDGITKLMDRAIEMNKFDNELQDKIDAREIENNIKLKQIEEDAKDRKVKNILTALGIAIPSGVTIWGALKTMKFEQTDIVTTSAGKNFIARLFKK